MMSTLKVLQNFPSQHKSLFYALVMVNPSNSHLITFFIDHAEPHISSLVVFEVLVTANNLIIHQWIIY